VWWTHSESGARSLALSADDEYARPDFLPLEAAGERHEVFEVPDDIANGSLVFSARRRSVFEPADYLATQFNTGSEPGTTIESASDVIGLDPHSDFPAGDGWFSVRTHFIAGAGLYEERITLHAAPDAWVAIESAEHIANSSNLEYMEYAESYDLLENPAESGAEVFSRLRRSTMAPAVYMDAFFGDLDTSTP